MSDNLHIAVVGSGTAGHIASLYFRTAFPHSQITNISSSKIGIVGVGEGSTEHWREFMDVCNIPVLEMLALTSATHKYGIRFENWSRQTPDYFHSVSGDENLFAFGTYPTYLGFIDRGKLLTAQTTTVGLTQNKIRRIDLHNNTNQFHFDTFKLNEYFEGLSFNRSIRLIDDEVQDINIDSETGNIKSVKISSGEEISADFWIDASGFARVLMTKLGNTEWVSFSEYLLCDSAIAFPTESDPSGEIRVYTRARAATSGWMWEIPTQERRGNGYVFSSSHISADKAFEEACDMTGYKPDAFRHFTFNPGYLKKQWVKNCVAVGLASSFVEPLEATSIGSTIQQVKALIPNLASYTKHSTKMQNFYNRNIEQVMRNILSMIRLHYISDRRDTPFWNDVQHMKINDELQELIELWSERPPTRYDSPENIFCMFQAAHFIHVAQGQNVLDNESAARAINRFGIKELVRKDMFVRNADRFNHEMVDHAQSLREINLYD